MLIVSRHGATVEWLREQGYVGEVIAHVSDPSVLDGQVVVGNLPLNLAARAVRVGAVEFDLPAEMRGQELTLVWLRENACVTWYSIRREEAPAGDAATQAAMVAAAKIGGNRGLQRANALLILAGESPVALDSRNWNDRGIVQLSDGATDREIVSAVSYYTAANEEARRLHEVRLETMRARAWREPRVKADSLADAMGSFDSSRRVVWSKSESEGSDGPEDE